MMATSSEATFRNDWTSALHPDNLSYFILPSVFYVFSESLKRLPVDELRKAACSVGPVWNDYGALPVYNK